jgi:hypothetical protein
MKNLGTLTIIDPLHVLINGIVIESDIEKDLTIFLEIVRETYSKYQYIEKILEETEVFIRNSNCKSIKFTQLRALGMALHNGVYLSNSILNRNLNQFLYVVYHEIAHQYQYKKYTPEYIYGIYSEDTPSIEGGKLLLSIENTADELSVRKIRKLVQKGWLPSIPIHKFYSSVSISSATQIVQGVKEDLKEQGLTEVEDISNYFYNKYQIQTKN